MDPIAVRYKKETNTVYGIEASSVSAERAKKLGIIVEQGDFMVDNFFENIQFDIVVAGEIIEHVFDTDALLQTIHKKLKDGGKLVITTPNVASLPRRILLLLGINPILDFRAIGNVAGHIRYFTFKTLKKMLNDNNFNIIKEESDILNFNNKGTFYSSLIPKFHKEFGKTIMIYAKKIG
jgi:2-polyprenyl-3-methyl-5-hydroxy-6-metoxy-1,4-benzoquinol methylase